MKASGLSRRVSTPLRRSNRGPQLLPKGGNHPSCCICTNVGTEEQVFHARVLPTPHLDARPLWRPDLPVAKGLQYVKVQERNAPECGNLWICSSLSATLAEVLLA